MPKYAFIERERRWRVDPAARPDLSALPFVLIEDRYLTGTRIRLRRMTDSATAGRALKVTKKYEADDPLARPIVTIYLTEAEYALLADLPGRSLVKRRYVLQEKEMMFSLDRFLGPLDGLELAEIELEDDATLRALRAPSWAIRDVSEDARYQGGALAISGRP